jgi:hypothetical protein
MSNLPYLCDFRVVVHTWDFDVDQSTQEKIEWEKSQIEILKVETWSHGFNFLSKTGRTINFIMNQRDPSSPQRAINMEYGHELLNESIVQDIVDSYVKPTGEKFFEIVGKLHEFTTGPNHEGEYDSETDVSEIEFQELLEEDICWLFKR